MKTIGVAQYFYHCNGEDLPIRDILNKNGAGSKTEPHYENMTENWCTQCLNVRMKSANRDKVDYLFLMTRYRKSGHKLNGELIVVGYLKRAKESRWIELSQNIPSGATPYGNDKDNCGFFAGDPKESKFVNVEDGYVLKGIGNARWVYFIDEPLGKKILKKLESGENITNKLIKRASELTKEAGITNPYNKNTKKNANRPSSGRC
jgi:hypothetical protein